MKLPRDPFPIAAAVLCVCLAISLYFYEQARKDCHRRGGIFMKSEEGMTCVAPLRK